MATHVAILLRTYINLILAGRKTIESRLTLRPLAPFHRIAPGDLIHFKASSGPYLATARAARTEFFHPLTPAGIERLYRRFNSQVCGPREYWQQKRRALYGSFIWLADVQPSSINPGLPPSHGPAWFVLPVAPPDPPALVIPLTAGALRNCYLRAPRELAGQLQLILPDGQTINTEVTPKGILRHRRWQSYFRGHHLLPGDAVHLVPLAAGVYRVQFHHAPRSAVPLTMSEPSP